MAITVTTKESAAASEASSIERAAAKSNDAAIESREELAKAYQALGAKNAERLIEGIKTLSAAKSTAEFFEQQQKLIQQGVDAAVADSGHIAKLTAALFAAAFAPLQKKIDTAGK